VGVRYDPGMGLEMERGPAAGRMAVIAARVLGAVATGGCASGRMPDRVTPEALLAAIDTGTAPVIVDVRTRREYEAGHVPGAIHVPFYTLLVRQDGIPGPRERPLVVYCEHGPRAGVARLALRLAGFTDVRYLDGHMSGWKQRGLPQELR
jgi:rhodanese-related sulfurtransferase